MPTPATNIVTLLQQALSVLQATQTPTQQTASGQAQPQTDEQVRKVIEIINAIINAGKDQPLGSVNGALGETIGNLLNGKKTAIGVVGALATSLLAQTPAGPGTALGGLLTQVPALAGLTGPALPIFIALAAWGALGKMEKWSGNSPTTK